MHSKKGLDLHVVFFINTSYYASEHVHVQCTVSIPYPFAGHLRLDRLQEVSEPSSWLGGGGRLSGALGGGGPP